MTMVCCHVVVLTVFIYSRSLLRTKIIFKVQNRISELLTTLMTWSPDVASAFGKLVILVRTEPLAVKILEICILVIGLKKYTIKDTYHGLKIRDY